MARGSLRVPNEVRTIIERLHPETKRKVRAALETLVADPTVGVPLRDDLTGFRRIRIGRWRVVYRERRRTIEIHAVGPRSTIYTDLIARLRK